MGQGRPKASKKLPRIRPGITVSFNDYDIEGKPQWLIHDPIRNKFFLIGWLEYEIMERWEVGDPNAMVESINQETTLQVDMKDIENFYEFLKRNYLIQLSGHEIHDQAKKQNLFKTDNLIHWLISNYLFFRIPLVHPDAFLTKTKWISDILFNRITFYLMSILALLAVYQLNAQWDVFTHTFSTIFNFQGMALAFIAYAICKCCHELGHAYMCKRYGIKVPAFGIAFLVFWPVLYTDTTLSWNLGNKERMRIALAGIWVETYIVILAALMWCNIDNQIIKSVCYVTITVNWVASVLINVSPFMRFDGYYVLADYLKMPNLQLRAFALTRWQIRRWLFDWPDPAPERFTRKMHILLVTYSIITWLYRLTVYFGIAILVYHFFAKAVGIILFLIELYYFILGPFVNEIQFWIMQRSKFTLNLHTKITLSLTLVMIILFFTPFSQTTRFPSTLSNTHQFLFAPEAGVLISKLPLRGSAINAQQPIPEIHSEKLEEAIIETRLEYEKTISQLRRAAINPDYTQEKNALQSDVKRLQAEYQKLINIKTKLTLAVPFNGVMAESATDLQSGSYVMKDQWLGDVVKPNSTMIEAFASQIDIDLIKVGETGYFYANNLSIPAVPVKVVSIEVMNAQQLDCSYSSVLKQYKDQGIVIETPCYNASELGGEIPTYQTDEGHYVPANSVYRIVLVPEKGINLNYVERGVAFISTRPRSYAERVFYYLKSTLIEELGL